jgi:hypothetical protein
LKNVQWYCMAGENTIRHDDCLKLFSLHVSVFTSIICFHLKYPAKAIATYSP